MKVEVKSIDEVKKELHFEIPKDRVEKAFDEVYTDLAKSVEIKGFRKGKVPRKILESRHQDLARDEVVKKLVPEVYQEGLVKENLEPVDFPQIAHIHFNDGLMTFQAQLEIRPEVKVKTYKGLKVQRKKSEVSDKEIETTLEYFRKGQGQDKDVKIDDEFAKGMGYPNLAEFKKSLSRQLEIDKDRQNRADVENQIVQALLKQAKFKLPETLVSKQMEKRLEEGRERLKSSGMPEEEIQKKEPEMRKGLAEAVENDVRVYFIMDHIARVEKIEAGENENLPAKVMEFLLKEAKWED